MKKKIRTFLLPDPNHWWTTLGALPILWNATHWRKGPHVSGLARKHPLATVLVLGAYGYHFLGPIKEKLIEEAVDASAGSGGSDS